MEREEEAEGEKGVEWVEREEEAEGEKGVEWVERVEGDGVGKAEGFSLTPFSPFIL